MSKIENRKKKWSDLICRFDCAVYLQAYFVDRSTLTRRFALVFCFPLNIVTLFLMKAFVFGYLATLDFNDLI